MAQPAAPGRRYLIATGTARLGNDPAYDLPEIVQEIAELTDFFRTYLGYEITKGIGVDLTLNELRDRLRAFLESPDRKQDDHIVFYYSGHANISDNQLILLLSDSDPNRPAISGLNVRDLTRFLLESPARKIFIMIDCCYAGAAIGVALNEALSAPPIPDQQTGRALEILVSAGALEVARSGGFARAFIRATTDSTIPPLQQYIPVETIAAIMERDPNKTSRQHIQYGSIGSSGSSFIPNPRYEPKLSDADLLTQLAIKSRQQQEEDIRNHFVPRARGIDSTLDEESYFTGRLAILNHLTLWAATPGKRVAVLTGDPGSGKSAVIGRLLALTATESSALPGDSTRPVASTLTRNTFDVVINARNKTIEDIRIIISSQVGSLGASLTNLIANMRDRETPLFIAIDSLDEAVDPKLLLNDLIIPLVHVAESINLRMLLGTRRELVAELANEQNVAVFDLDDDEYADPAAIAMYVRRCLVTLSPSSPYKNAPDEIIDSVARAVAKQAGHSFLVALLVARQLVASDTVPDVGRTQWIDMLPTSAAEALELDFEQRLGIVAPRARSMLLPLAFAQDTGLSLHLWSDLIEPLSDMHVTDVDMLWIMDVAKRYIVESISEGQSFYRLYHRALAEFLIGNADTVAFNSKIVSVLKRRVPTDPGGRPKWETADRYTRMNLAAHAVAAGRIDELVLDPAFLLAAEPDRLKAAFSAVKSDAARSAVREYQRKYSPQRIDYLGSSDRPSSHDHLYRESVVAVLTELLAVTSTDVTSAADAGGPTVVAIQGAWGSGKTTVMQLLKENMDRMSASSLELEARPGGQTSAHRLTAAGALWKLWRGRAGNIDLARTLRHRTSRGLLTVWFNPWSYQSSEQTWAGLAREVIDRCTQAILVDQNSRERYWFARNMGRLDTYAVRKTLLKGIVSPILGLGVLLALIPIIAKLIDPGAKYTLWGHHVGFAIVIAAVPTAIIVVGIVHTILRAFLSHASFFLPPDIFAGPVGSGVMAESSRPHDNVLHDPLYQSRSGYLYLLQHDVSEVLRDMEKTGWDVIVFIDDLDRCSPKTTGEVFEAINVFLAQLFPSTRFVLGIDPFVVAAHLDVVFKDIPLQTSTPLGDDPSVGWTFLRKLIQMPVVLPWISDRGVGSLLRSVLGQTKDMPTETSEQVAAVGEGAVSESPIDGVTSGAITEFTRLDTPAMTVVETVEASGPEISVLSDTPRLVPVSVLEQDSEVLALIQQRLSAQPIRSAREAKRILTVWQFFVRVSERIEPLGGTDAIERAKNLIILAEISCRWPAIQGHLMRKVSADMRALERLALAADNDETWARAVHEALLDDPSCAASMTNLRHLLQECSGQAVAQLADRLF